MTDRPVLPWLAPVDLPELGVLGALAKLDTGGRGTVVHATGIRVDGVWASFVLHPWPGEPDRTVAARAGVSDRRRVTSSNGQAESRVFVRTLLALPGLPPRPVEISLSARPLMRFRMLIGREALAQWGVLVDPGATSVGPLG